MFMKNNHMRKAAVLSAATALILAGCTENTKSSQKGEGSADTSVVEVSSTDDACKVSVNKTTSGATTFTIKNDGSKTTEFYLLGSDRLRVVAERENIAPGASGELVVTLQPGEYFTACKPGMRGGNVGEAAFTVTGEAIKLTDNEKAQFDAVVSDYVNFVKNEVSQLVPNVEEFANAYMAGDDDKARALYPKVRVHYERIEPIAEALGSLDPRIDFREIDYLAEAEAFAKEDPTFNEWLGFHRIEKDLWPPAEGTQQPDRTNALEGWKPSSSEDRQRIGKTLIEDVNKLYETVHSPTFIQDQQIDISTVSNGAASLLEEVAVNKVTGEENWWSHYDLWDFQANVQGAKIAFDLVAPIAEDRGGEAKELVEDIRGQFAKLQEMLDAYGNLEKGYVLYDTVTVDQQRELTNQINSTREPLGRLTAAVLGIK